MAISGEDIRRRTGVDRILSWFETETEDEELSAEAAYQTLEDEYLY